MTFDGDLGWIDFAEGDWLSLDGTTGDLYLGQLPTVHSARHDHVGQHQVNLPVVGGYTWNTSQLSIDGTVSLVASAIPEPAASAALVGAGLLAFAGARRRRRG